MYLPPVLSGNMISISSFFAPFFTILGQGAIIHCRAIVIVLNIALLCLFHHQQQQCDLLLPPQQQQLHHPSRRLSGIHHARGEVALT